MAGWDSELALRHAPVLLQKAHPRWPRSDFITRIDFAGPWTQIHSNWRAIWARKGDRFAHPAIAHAYYSVVATHTHHFLLYAFYHPQNWSAFWGDPARSKASRPSQHLHDMEGCLAVVPKRGKPGEEEVEVLLTVSHHDFYSYACKEDDRGRPLGSRFRISGWTEDVDGTIRMTSRFAHLPGEPAARFKLYADSGGHAIKGNRRAWGREDHVVRYRPSHARGREPQADGFQDEGTMCAQDVAYKLISVFARGGLWAHREDAAVFQADAKGREAFVVKDSRGRYVPGSANPPWGWDDHNDAHKPGCLAWDPAHLVADYFDGLREFSLQYVHNPYVGIRNAEI